MNKTSNEIEDLLPSEAKELFLDIESQRILGASNHIRMIFEMMVLVAQEGATKEENVETVIRNLVSLSDYFISTRGEASQAISNAILKMRQSWINNKYLNSNDLSDAVSQAVVKYNEQARLDTDKIIAYAVELSKEFSSIMIYDYSSTVEKVILNISDRKRIIIPESRIISGGIPYLESIGNAGHEIKFIPDAAIGYYLKKCDAVFMGAETFYADGTGFNTTGSDMVGVLCKEYNVPLYFLTPMIKLDLRPTVGKKKEQVYNDVSKIYKHLDLNLDYRVPELLGVQPEYIKAFISEYGIIPSYAMYSVSIEYAKELRGGNIYG